jgi:hypothetical protein
MAVDLLRITAALNAYPWIAGTLTARSPDGPRYCAMGLLLRYAGVPQDHMACAAGELEMWDRYGELLRADYGIECRETVRAIILANDSARSHAQAIERVQAVLAGGGLRLALRYPEEPAPLAASGAPGAAAGS